MKHQVFFLLLLAISMHAAAQDSTTFNSKYFKCGLYYFDDTFKLQKPDIFTTYKSQFGLGCHDSMALINEGAMDSIDTKSSRYQQYYKGYPVEIAKMNVISKYNVVLYANGFVIKNLHTNVCGAISEDSALSNALAYINAPEYAWQDSSLENNIKITGIDTTDSACSRLIYDSSATYYPKGQLVIARPFGDTSWNDTSKYALCWKFTITPMRWDTVIVDTSSDSTIVVLDTSIGYKMAQNSVVYVNAISGEIYTNDPNVHSGYYVSCGVHPTWYYGNQNIQAYTTFFDYYYHFKDTRHNSLYDYTSSSSGNILKSSTDNLGGENTGYTGYWELEKAWDYFHVVHGFLGADNNYVSSQLWKNCTTLSYSGDRAEYQPGIQTVPVLGSGAIGYDIYYLGPDRWYDGKSAAVLDVMGHEFTHAVIYHGPNLLAYGESNYIAEGFCDYFGTMVARWQGSTTDFSYGYMTGDYHLSFDRPNWDYPVPGAEWYLDYGMWSLGDPVRNSGVLRHFFGLITDGGSYLGYTVNPISNVETDAFVTMEWWCWGNMDYMDLRNQFLAEYTYYYGFCSPQWKSVVTAWAAVNLGTVPSCKRAFIYGQGVATSDEISAGSVSFTASAGDGVTTITAYNWIIPPTWIAVPIAGGSQLLLNNVTDNSSQFVTCIVTYDDGTFDSLTTFLHIVDCETEDCDMGRQVNPIQRASPQANNDVQIFPNPASNKLNIVIPSLDQTAVLQIFDVAGKEILQENITQTNSVLLLPAISEGMYIIKINNSKLNVVRKVIIE